ncbi:hypothetical protein FOCC_FOCC013215 [Frankliniella occidentalis]|nr:hypothetical protein FOCC_FOCC013215 [Frankliniella occidentalis]
MIFSVDKKTSKVLTKRLQRRDQIRSQLTKGKVYSPNVMEEEQPTWAKKVMTSQFCMVHGMPGTGKTYLLKMCVKHLQYNLGHSAVKVVAPTGVAAKLVNGNTIHSFLSLGGYGFNVDSLSGIDLPSFRQKHEGLKFLFIDECSMVGLRMLACLEKRCRELTDDLKTFGGLKVFFFGDYNQLCPIGDQPLYSDTNIYSQNNSLLERGKFL